MTKSRFLAVVAAVVVSVAFVACDKDNGNGNGGNNGNGSSGNKITMVVIVDGPYDESYVGMAGSGSVTIDWGDGTKPESFTLTTVETYYSHPYPSGGGRTITITGNVTYLDCWDCETLDISKNTALTHLSCQGYFKSLDVSKHTALTELSIEADLTSLDVSKNTALTYLDIVADLTSLDVSKNTALTHLGCGGYFKSLDVSKNTALTYLGISADLTSLDVSKNTALTYLGISADLTSLDVSKCTKLAYLGCSSNKLSAAALNALFGTLHSNTTYGENIIYIYGNPGAYDCDRSIAENKGWEVWY